MEEDWTHPINRAPAHPVDPKVHTPQGEFSYPAEVVHEREKLLRELQVEHERTLAIVTALTLRILNISGATSVIVTDGELGRVSKRALKLQVVHSTVRPGIELKVV